MNRRLEQMRCNSTVAFVVDLQERLLPAIHEAEAIIGASERLLRAVRILDVPILATEQYPAGLGRTHASICQSWGDVRPIEKMRFSGCVEEVMEGLAKLDRPHILVVGIEAHVCVLQTVLDLLRRGYTPFVCADAVSSRRPEDRDIALERMRDAGAIITTVESTIFELLGEAGTDRFKQILKLIK